MNKGKVAALALVGCWAAGGAIVVACSSDEPAVTTSDAGVDAHPTATATTTATATATTTATSDADTGAPPDDDAGVDAGPHGLWGFNAYCPDDAGDDAGCNIYDKCPGFDGGGIAAQECDTPLKRCVSHGAADSGLKDRLFLCESTATNVWELNRICTFQPCDDIDAAATCTLDAGVGGLPCATPADHCLADNGRVFVCQPNSGLVEVFNGYCDAGAGITACPLEAGTCTPDGGGQVAASTCTTNLERCTATQANGVTKVFVCGDRSP